MNELLLNSHDDHESIIDDLLVSGLSTFDDVLRVVQQLPYGRNENRFDPELVWTERMGTCSSKHAFLKKLATEQGFESVKLILAVYKMNNKNTPGIGNVLENSTLPYVPEAHCYISINGERIDVTFPDSDIKKLMPDILEEQFIEWSDVGTFKVEYHQEFIKKWLKTEDISLSFEEVWEIREKCIAALA
ncbi:MAG: hypothetical protein ACI8YQ_003601 [Polaribacter sp.]|jgi:hypothetical protein